MMKKYLLIALAIFVLLFASNYKTQENTNEREIIKIGVTLPLTGDLAYLTANMKAIALHAENELNANQANHIYDYKIIIEDNGFEGKKGALTANKLISVDKVNALISSSSKIGNVVSPIADKYKTIHINPFASDRNVAKGKYNFINWTQPDEQCKKLIEIFKNKNIKNVVTLLANDPGAIAVANVCEKMMVENDIINHNFTANYSEKDFRTTLMKAKEHNPDIYFLLHFPPAINLVTKQMRQSNIETPITAIEAIYFVGDDSNFDNTWFVTSAEITEDYLDVFLKAKVNDNIYGVGNIYDTIHLLVNAFETVGTNSDDVSEYLLSVKDYNGVVGNLSVDEDGVFNSKAIAKIKKGNQFLPYEAN